MSTKPQNDQTKKADPEITGSEKKELGDEQLASIAAGSGAVIAASPHGKAVEFRRDAEVEAMAARRY